ncbi:MAG: acyl-CoA dehydrogenase family protein, partial [Myxococcales bacterium]|nr:acyl-CoA dehydrogenase family protein [Myxococcales bacterium]
MSSSSFVVDLEDHLFALFDQHRAHEKLAAYPAYEGMDREVLTAALEEARRVAQDVLAPANRVGDHEGVRFDGQGNVSTPAVFKEAWQVMAEGGWIAVDGPVDVGGMGLPHAIHTITQELFSGAATA